jgi:hypothetical protein
VAFKIVMKVRRTLLWMFVVASLGLTAGWTFKVYLENLLQLQTARRDGLLVAQSIDTALAQNPDPQLATAVQAPRADLGAAIVGKDPPVINEKAKAAKETLATQLQALKKSQGTPRRRSMTG